MFDLFDLNPIRASVRFEPALGKAVIAVPSIRTAQSDSVFWEARVEQDLETLGQEGSELSRQEEPHAYYRLRVDYDECTGLSSEFSR